MPGTEIRIALPAVRDLAETIVRRLEAGIVEPDVYLAEMLDTLERKRNAIGEAHLAGELQDDQAEHGSYIAEQQIELVEAIIRGRAHDARVAARAKCKTPLERIAFDNDPANGTTAERIVAMTETRTDDELHAEHDQLEEGDFYTGHTPRDADLENGPNSDDAEADYDEHLARRPLVFEAIVALTGDRAHADSPEAALVAADTLCRDHQNDVGTHGALKAARATVYITENGTYAGILTAFARQGETRIA